MIDIVESGVLSTVQDQGRPGHAHLGVPHSGAVDPALAWHCNRLVGNAPDAAVLETVGGLVVRATAPVTIATDLEAVGRTLRVGDTVELPPGERTWHYLAVRGGVMIERILGSRSTDTLSGLGPPPLRAGDELAVGPEPSGAIVGEVSPVRPHPSTARVLTGPRLDWFEAGTFDTISGSLWTVGATSRVGVRLAGAALQRRTERELPSEGLVRGAIQVPPDGDPIMMLADHPTTGGYPVVAVVHPDDVANVAQTATGGTIRLRSV